MIRVNCFFKANEGKYNDALEAAIALVAASQQDEGVVSYDCFESATRGEIFLICETWKDKPICKLLTLRNMWVSWRQLVC